MCIPPFFPRGHDIILIKVLKKKMLKTFPVSLQICPLSLIGVASSIEAIKGKYQRSGFGISTGGVHILSKTPAEWSHRDAASASTVTSWIFERLIYYLFDDTKELEFSFGRLLK